MTMRVAALARRFPSLSQTFVLGQITGLLEQGCDVEVFADAPDEPALVHPAVAAQALPARTTYYGIPPGYLARLRRAGELWRGDGWGAPDVRWRALDLRRYGREAASLRLLFEARAFTRRSSYDVVHAHFGPCGALAATLRDLGVLDAPLVTTFYGYDVSRRGAAAGYAALFRAGARFLVLGERMRERLVALGGDPRRITVHRLGVDLRALTPATPAPRRAGLEILSIARFVPKKGLEYALRAVAALARQAPGVRYTVVGDGPLRPQLARLAHALRLGDVVRFVGWQTQPAVLALLRHADVLLAPSVTAPDGDAEGTPVAILEAQALARPVVATTHEGIPEIVAHGESGFLAPERDVAALTDALARLLATPALRREMGEAGRALVAERHDLERLNRALLALYEDVRGSG